MGQPSGSFGGGVAPGSNLSLGAVTVDTLTLSRTSPDVTLSRANPEQFGVSWPYVNGLRPKTSDTSNATTTFASTGFSISTASVASDFYYGDLILFCNNTIAADGIKFDFNGGSATVLSFIAQGTVTDTVSTRNLARVTALSTAITDATLTGSAIVKIHFTFQLSSQGTLIPRFAMNAATTGNATVSTGSSIRIYRY